MLRKLRNLVGGKKSKPLAAYNKFKLQLEYLEGREVPAVLAAWDVNGNGSPIDTTLPADTVAANMATTAGLNTLARTTVTGVSTANAFNSSNWNITNTFNQNTNYIGFTIAPSAGFTLNLTDLQHNMQGSNTAPNTGRWGYSTDGGTTFTLQPTFTMTGTTTARTWDFADFTATGSVEFRYWSFGTTSINGGTSATGGTTRIGDINTPVTNDLVVNGTITGGATAPTFAITPLSAVKPEGNTGSAPATDYTFTVTRTGLLTANDAVTYTVTGTGTNPANGTDFVGGAFPTGTVTFTDNTTTTQTVTIQVNGDTDAEFNEGFRVTLSNPVQGGSPGGSIGGSPADGTIQTDDGFPAPVSPAGDVAIISYDTQGTPTDNFTIVLMRDLPAGYTFFANDNEIATAGGTTFTNLDEAEAQFTANANLARGTVITLPWGAAAVTNDLYTWSATTGAGFANPANDEIYLYQAASITSTTPTAFIYYAQLGSSTSAVPAGLASGQTAINPTATGAGRYKTTGATYTGTAGTLLAAIGNTAANWESAVPGTYTFSVTDATAVDASIALSTVTYQPVEGDTGSANAVVTLTRVGNLASEVTVKVSTSPGTTNPATAGTDYTELTNFLVTFAANQSVATVNVPILGDFDAEQNETITVTLTDPLVVTGTGNAVLGTPSTTTVTILDNDNAAPAPGALLLNEVYFNNPGADAGNEFVEIRNTTANPITLNNVYYVAVEGDDIAATAGSADRVISLNGQTIPANGILVIKSSLSSLNFGSATVFNTTAFDADAIENGSNTHFLVFSAAPIVQGTDYDADNNGTLEGALASATVLDRIGYRDGAPTDLIYGPAIPVFSNVTPDSISRFPSNTSTSAGAWFGGALVSSLPLTYAETIALDGLPLGAVVTPGAANYATPAAGQIKFAANGFTGNEGGNITVTLTRTGGSTGAVDAVVTATELSTAFPGTESYRATSGSDFAGSPAPVSNVTLTWSGGVVTVQALNHGLVAGDAVAIAGVTPAGYNGGFVVASVIDANTFTYALATDPGAALTPGTSQKGILVSWAAGDSADKSFTIAVPQDTDAEGNESFDLRIAGVTGGAVTTIRTAAGVVNADDLATAAPVVYVNEVKVDVAGSDGPFEYIELRGAPNQVLTNVYVVSVEGDAQFATITGATWNSGTSTATLTVSDSLGILVGDQLVVSGVVSAGPGSFNGTFTVTAVTATTISYALANDPGTYDATASGSNDRASGPQSAKPGTFDYVFDLNGQSLGSNGLLILRGSNGHLSVDPATTVVVDARFDSSSGILENGTVSHLVIYSPTALTQATVPSGGAYELASDYDRDNNGSLEVLPTGAVLLDGIGWNDGDFGDISYGSFLTSGPTAFPPNMAATRVLESTTPFSPNGFRQGDLLFTTNAELAYDFANANAPAGGFLTPGGANFSQVANPAGTLSFTAATVSTSEGSSVVLTVTRVGGSTGVVTVNYALANVSTTAADYGTPTPASPLSWADGDTAPKTITIPIVDDPDAEGAEQFTVTLSGVTGGATLGSPSVATITINASDNPTPVVVLNEILVNPTGTDDNREYVEIRSQNPNTSLAGVWLLVLEGDASTARGTVDIAVDLSALSTGTANLLTLGNGYVTSNPYGLTAGATTLANLGTAQLENGAVTLLLVTNFTGAVGTDYDADNNGTLDSTPWGTIIDSVGWVDGGTAGSVVYAGAPVIPMNPATSTQDAATRFPANQSPNTLAAWWAGEILDDANAGTVDITYDGAIAGSGNIPTGAVLTPGASNYVAGTGPTVTGLSPTSGSTAGGNTVTISGTNFTGATQVLFGANAATNLVVVNATTITVTAPAGAAGTVNVSVTTPNGTSPNVAADDYTYTAGNTAPTITAPNSGNSPAAISVAENTTAVADVDATDSDTPAQTLTYSLSGPDAALFTIVPSTGVVTFTAAPDFETPLDQGANNVYNVTVTVTDNGTGNLTDTIDLVVTVTDVTEVTTFRVTSLTGTNPLLPTEYSSGFRINFGGGTPNDDTINLYDNVTGGTLGAADVVVLASGGDGNFNSGNETRVRGSLVFNGTTVTFIAARGGSTVVPVGGDGDAVVEAGEGGVLANDTYQVTLVSGSAAFNNGTNNLDGDGDGTYEVSDNYVTTFVVNRAAGTRVVSMPDFARGPAQGIGEGGAADPTGDDPLAIPNTGTAGIPVYLSQGSTPTESIGSIQFVLQVDPTKFVVTGATTTLTGWTASSPVALGGGQYRFVMFSSGPEVPQLANVQILSIQGYVPSANGTANYGTKQIFTFPTVTNPDDTFVGGFGDNKFATVWDTPLHALMFLGDATGNGAINAADASQTAVLSGNGGAAANPEHGFAGGQNLDPFLLADPTGNAVINAADASQVAVAAGSQSDPSIANIPGVPTGFVTPASVTGTDPTLFLTSSGTASVGGTVQVVANIDTLLPLTGGDAISGMTLVIEYDATKFSYAGITNGSFITGTIPGGGSWSITVQPPSPNGELRVVIFNDAPLGAAYPTRVIDDLFTLNFNVLGGAGTSAAFNLRANSNVGANTEINAVGDGGNRLLALVPAPQNGADSNDTTVSIQAASVRVEIPDVTVNAGQTFTVPIILDTTNLGPITTGSGNEIIGFTMPVTFDNSKLTFVSAALANGLNSSQGGLSGWSLTVVPTTVVNQFRLVGFTGDTNGYITGTYNQAAVNLTFTANANASGTTVINLIADAGDGTLLTINANGENGNRELPVSPTVTNNNTDTVDSVVTIQVQQNTAPVNTVPGTQDTLRNRVTPIAGVSVADAEVTANAANIQVQLVATGGTVAVTTAGGATVTGNSTGTLTVTGLITDVNDTLASLVFTPTAGFVGNASVAVNTSDLGNTGLGGALTDSDTIPVRVAQLLINEVAADTPGNDAPNEYVEIRSSAGSGQQFSNFVIPSGTYFLAIEGEPAAANPGDVNNGFDLSNRVTGSNGFLVLLQKEPAVATPEYALVQGATVLKNSGTGAGFGNGASSNIGAFGDGTDIENPASTYLLINTTPGSVTATTDIDTGNNGTTNTTFASWNIQDSIGIGNNANGFLYGLVNFRGTAAMTSTTGPVTALTFAPVYVGRLGNSTGTATTDWVVSGALAGTDPNFTLNATAVSPTNFGGRALNHVGGTNFTLTAQVFVNDGASNQRSQVTKLTVVFSEAATINPAAFVLTGPNGTVTLNVNQVSSTVVELTFAGGTDTITIGDGVQGSGNTILALADGNFSLSINGSLITDASGRQLDGDLNGIAGGNQSFAFHRLFGDHDGDKDVDGSAVFEFGQGYGFNSTDNPDEYNTYAFFDFDGDGDIDDDDALGLGNNWGIQLP